MITQRLPEFLQVFYPWVSPINPFWGWMMITAGLALPVFTCLRLINFKHRTASFENPKLFIFYAAILTGFLGLILVFTNQKILYSFFNSGDEFSCYFFARCLAAGKLWASPPELKEFFTVAHVGMIGDKWFSVYPPGWPLVWSLGMRLGLSDLTNPLLTVCFFIAFLQLSSKITGKRVALFAGLFLLASPFFTMTGAAYFSHNLCLLLGVLFYQVGLNWISKPNIRDAVLAAFFLVYGIATRYLTMVMLIAPLFFYFGYLRLTRKNQKWTGWIYFCVIFLLGMGVHIFYNRLVTGSYFDAPNHYLHSHEKLGFIAGYTPRIALEYLWRRFVWLFDWTPPFLTILFLIGLFRKTGNRWLNLMKGSIILTVLGYALYYSWGGNQFGPRYYYEIYPFMVLIAAQPVVESYRRCQRPWQRNLILALILSSVFVGVFMHIRHWEYYERVSFQRKQTYDFVEKNVKRPALVFLKGYLGDRLIMASDDIVRNDPFLSEKVIYAHDLGKKNAELQTAFPGFYYYKAEYDRVKLQPVLREETI